MRLFKIKSPTTWSAATDRAEYLVRFAEDMVPELEAGRHIAHSVKTLNSVLDSILQHLLENEGIQTRVGWSTLDVADKCELLDWAFGRTRHIGAASHERLRAHVSAVMHYDCERSRLLQAEFQSPGSLTLVEMADLADALLMAALELEEWMTGEHPNFACVLNGAQVT